MYKRQACILADAGDLCQHFVQLIFLACILQLFEHVGEHAARHLIQQGVCIHAEALRADVKALLAGGMGMRPLMGFQQVGVNVFFAGQYPTVGAAVQAFLDGKLPPFTMDLSLIHISRQEESS